MNRILVPVTFDETSARVLDVGRRLADGCGASLHLLHVIAAQPSPPDAVRCQQEDVCARLDALLTADDRARRDAVTACRVGTPAAEIVRYAADEGIDLIVMGTHSHGPAFQMATGSIAECVLGLAPCAVLAVKGGGTRPYDAVGPAAAAVSTGR